MLRKAIWKKKVKQTIKFIKSNQSKIVSISIILLLFISIAFHIFIFAGIKFMAKFSSAGGDICPYNRAIALMSKGRIFNSLFELENVANLPYHFFPIFWLFLPLYVIFPGPFTLDFLETFFIALGAIPIYLLARDKLKSKFAGLVFSICYLLYPALQGAELFDFHPKLISISLILFAFYYIEKNNFKYSIIFVSLSLLTQESVSIMVAILGIYTIFIVKNKRLGLTIFSMGVVWAFLTMGLIMPTLYEQPSYFNIHSGSTRWSHLGDTSTEVVINTLTNPVYAVTHDNFDMKVEHFIHLFMPLGFISFLDPLPMLVIFHEAFLNFTSAMPPDFYSTSHHYQGIYVPFIFISAIGGVRRLSRLFKSRVNQKILLNLILIAILSLSIISNELYNQEAQIGITLTGTPDRFYRIITFKPSDHYYLLMDIIDSIPKNSTLVADNDLCGYVALFDEVYMADETVGRYEAYEMTLEYALHDSVFADEIWWEKLVPVLNIQDNYTLVNSTDGILLYRRKT